MSYMDIPNVYKTREILLFRECYALEKIHGTSAHLKFTRMSDDLSSPEKCAEVFLRNKGLTITPHVFEQIVLSLGKNPNELLTSDMKYLVEHIKQHLPDVDIQEFHSVYNSFCTLRNQYCGWNIHLFSGGAPYDQFRKIFDLGALAAGMNAYGYDELTVYGEAYGGKMQGMSSTYGGSLKFVAFEVLFGGNWLNVANAEQVVAKLGLEFVPYSVIPATIEALDAIILADSVQAVRNGMGSGHKREGVVVRPLIELRKNNNERVIAKHKRADFQETKTPRPLSQEKLKVLAEADEIASEWVTEMRLTHVLDLFPKPYDISQTGDVIKAMIADVIKESKNEIIDSKEARAAIGKRTASLFKNLIKTK